MGNQFLEVAVNAPIGPGKTLSYSVPSSIDLPEPGQMVWAPLGSRPVQGIVFQRSDSPQVEAVRDIISALEPSPLLDRNDLELASWMSRYYLSSLFEAASLMLPTGFENRVISWLRVDRNESTGQPNTDAQARQVMEILDRREVKEGAVVKSLGAAGERVITRLINSGLLKRRWEFPRPKRRHRYRSMVHPVSAASAEQVSQLSPRQKEFYDALMVQGGMEAPDANKAFGGPLVARMVEKGLASMEWVRLEANPAVHDGRTDSYVRLELTGEQMRAVSSITDALDRKPGSPSGFLLHGVTGSGKTEVYLRALERCISAGKQGVYLVPEISLTPQTLHRLNSRFPGKVAVLHSGMTPAQRFEQWWRINDGEFDVVVGPRSALFAPVREPGLIIIDEEHEWTYKQHDSAPRFHTRTVAHKLAELKGAVVVAGSATPDVETYSMASRGRGRLLELSKRVPSVDGSRPTLPAVEIQDMRKELREGNRSIFSTALSEALSNCIQSGQQAIFYVNRRGSSTVVQCRDCGHSLKCGGCSVTLTFHGDKDRLVCHQCNRRTKFPKSCPKCRSPRVRRLGLGTQLVMEEVRRRHPWVRALRWDRDSVSSGSHEAIMDSLLKQETQILVGTQMVAKGLHLPNVTLIGVVLADVGLHLPDFRAGEKVFQLLCQVAGRAGRGPVPGRVIIQTYDPNHYAVAAAAAQDYGRFYHKEMEYRRSHGNPPYNRLIRMAFGHVSQDKARREAERMGALLRQKVYDSGGTHLEIIGPAPAFPERVRGRHRWHLVLRGRDLHRSISDVSIPQGWTVDVDPVSVM